MLQRSNARQSKNPAYKHSYSQARQLSAFGNCIVLNSEQLMTVPKQEVQIYSMHFK
jgi:hypothetical protein